MCPSEFYSGSSNEKSEKKATRKKDIIEKWKCKPLTRETNFTSPLLRDATSFKHSQFLSSSFFHVYDDFVSSFDRTIAQQQQKIIFNKGNFFYF